MTEGIEFATDYARMFKYPPQGKNESDTDFRARVSGRLRDEGHLIEAHEVHSNARYEDSENVVDGIFGAAAMAMDRKDYGSRGHDLIGDEIAAGGITRRSKKPKMSMAEMMMAIFLSEK